MWKLLARLPARWFPKTLQPVQKAMRDAGLKVRRSRCGDGRRCNAHAPIQRAVGEFFRQEPLTNLESDKVVALGAATQANLLLAIAVAGTTGCCWTSSHCRSGLKPWVGLVRTRHSP